jgi:hypothetical protein
MELLLDEGKEIPPSDTTKKGGVLLSLSLNLKPGPRVKRAKK